MADTEDGDARKQEGKEGKGGIVMVADDCKVC